MKKKLTLSMHEKDIRAARRIAKEHHTSISDMFSRLVRVMAAKRRTRPKLDEETLPPLTRKALGMISLPEGKTDRELIEEALLEKTAWTDEALSRHQHRA